MIRSVVSRGIRAIRRELDARDLVFVAGLGMLGYGVALVSVPAACAVVGAVLARVAWGRGRPHLAPRGVR
jgi:TctA family transporter